MNANPRGLNLGKAMPIEDFRALPDAERYLFAAKGGVVLGSDYAPAGTEPLAMTGEDFTRESQQAIENRKAMEEAAEARAEELRSRRRTY